MKYNMVGDIWATSIFSKAYVSFMNKTITKKNAWSRTIAQLMLSIRMNVGIAKIAEDFEMFVIQCFVN